MNISTSVLCFSNATSQSHISETHTSYLWYNVIPIRILVKVSDVTDRNDSVTSTPGICMYPLTTFLYFRIINLSGSSFLLNTHFTGTGFITFAFTTLLFVVIHNFLGRKLFATEIADIFHKCPFGLFITPLGVSGYPTSV